MPDDYTSQGQTSCSESLTKIFVKLLWICDGEYFWCFVTNYEMNFAKFELTQTHFRKHSILISLLIQTYWNKKGPFS